jgi:hypothetical protein
MLAERGDIQRVVYLRNELGGRIVRRFLLEAMQGVVKNAEGKY